MNLEKLKKAEIVYGEKLDHPDDTYGDGHIGSEISVTVESYGFTATVSAAMLGSMETLRSTVVLGSMAVPRSAAMLRSMETLKSATWLRFVAMLGSVAMLESAVKLKLSKSATVRSLPASEGISEH